MSDTLSNYLEPDEVRKLITAVGEVSHNAERDLLIIELLWQSGARVTEAITLLPERIGKSSVVLRNLKQVKRIKVDGKSKHIHNPDALKEVEVSEELCDHLRQFCDTHNTQPGDWVFKGHSGKKCVTRWYVWWVLGKAAEHARIFRYGKRNKKTGGRFKGIWPHALRHSNAMFLLEVTQDISLVKEQLGHANIATTQQYAFTKRPKIKKEVSKIDW